MKKILILAVCLMLATIPAVTATTTPSTLTQPILAPTGTFTGTIGYKGSGGNWTAVGTINGTYTLRTHGGHFTGDWTLQLQNTSASGTMRGNFFKPFFFGRVAITGGRHAPVVGFLFTKNETFGGRFMSTAGPALYFKGTYT